MRWEDNMADIVVCGRGENAIVLKSSWWGPVEQLFHCLSFRGRSRNLVSSWVRMAAEFPRRTSGREDSGPTRVPKTGLWTPQRGPDLVLFDE